jgi:hypothetical protein
MAGGQFGGGIGTAATPYLIEDAADLNQIRNKPNVYYKLVSNINLGMPPFNSGKGWVPISGFTGSLDGNGKKIFNLYINRPEEDYVALFRQFNPQSFDQMLVTRVKDLGLENIDITGRDYVGAIIGDYAMGDLRGNPNDPTYAVFTRCSVQGAIKGRNYVGGLGGRYFWDALSSTYSVTVAWDCCSDVVITPLPGGSCYGQIFGVVRDHWAAQYNVFYLHNCIGKCKIDNSLVATPTNIGVMAWHTQGTYFMASDCRYDKTLWPTTGITINANSSVGLTTADMTDPSKFTFLTTQNMDGVPVWAFLAGKCPELYLQSPDYLFVCGDNGYYTYLPTAGWIKQYNTVPSRQQAIDKGMRRLEYIPQAAWDYFKTHGDPYVVNVMDKSDSMSIYGTPFNLTKDTANSNSSKSIFRKEFIFSTFSGNLSTINI